ncbi:uncharacterized protein DS421_8g225760 [Arachis hypogaea]|nr:uncharacterized protein DS421_8g225760 [Arachis hypogaea]
MLRITCQFDSYIYTSYLYLCYGGAPNIHPETCNESAKGVLNQAATHISICRCEEGAINIELEAAHLGWILANELNHCGDGDKKDGP